MIKIAALLTLCVLAGCQTAPKPFVYSNPAPDDPVLLKGIRTDSHLTDDQKASALAWANAQHPGNIYNDPPLDSPSSGGLSGNTLIMPPPISFKPPALANAAPRPGGLSGGAPQPGEPVNPRPGGAGDFAEDMARRAGITPRTVNDPPPLGRGPLIEGPVNARGERIFASAAPVEDSAFLKLLKKWGPVELYEGVKKGLFVDLFTALELEELEALAARAAATGI
jgi:hypothetical protein